MAAENLSVRKICDRISEVILGDAFPFEPFDSVLEWAYLKMEILTLISNLDARFDRTKAPI